MKGQEVWLRSCLWCWHRAAAQGACEHLQLAGLGLQVVKIPATKPDSALCGLNDSFRNISAASVLGNNGMVNHNGANYLLWKSLYHFH